ncbi:MAG: hypothetical protein ACFFC7_07655 [Candidatus Hermodarchaeota archaeon]
MISLELEGVIIFNSSSGINLFSMVNEGLEPALISGALTAIKQFCQKTSLGGLSSFTTEEKSVFLATKGDIGTAIITSKNLDPKHVYSLAFTIAETFERKYKNTGITERRKIHDSFAGELEELLKKELPESILEEQTIYLYTVDPQGELQTLTLGMDLSTYPVLILINTIIKQIFVIENQADVSNRLLFFASRAASQLNRQQWRNEFRIRDISDSLDCQRIIEQAQQLLVEVEN